MRIGIVGSGIAGLTAGWIFQRAGADVTVFEQQSSLGMDAHCVEFEIENKTVRADVPSRMFNSSLWPNLYSLYEKIGVAIEPVDPAKTYARLGESALLKLGASYQPVLTPGILLDSSIRQIRKEIGRMQEQVPSDLNSPLDMTMAEYLRSRDYSPAFIYRFLYPALSSTVCTCSYDSLDEYPAAILLNTMLHLIQPAGLFRTREGTRSVVEPLVSGINDLRIGTSVKQVNQADVIAEVETEDGETIRFDQVILATQASAAASLISPESVECQVLNSFKHETVSIVIHTDESLMPGRSKDWSTFNMLSNSDDTAAMCTIWMNRFCPEWNVNQPVFQTIMPLVDPRADSIIGQTGLQRPVVNSKTVRALEMLSEIHDQPDRRVWFCGSYASPGMPLLESGVCSSLNVARRLGVDWPDPCPV